MHQLCPRCSNAVYAAEQVIGPGRKLYHKSCLLCTICNKRLDSYTLLEHDQKPYCKSCHVKNFGTRDLRQANLPHRDLSPTPEDSPPLPRVASPVRMHSTGVTKPNGNSGGNTSFPRLRPNRSLVTSPLSPTFPDRPWRTENGQSPEDAGRLESDRADTEEEQDAGATDLHLSSSPEHSTHPPFPSSRPSPLTPSYTGTPANSGRPGLGSLPRTIPLSLTRSAAATYGPTSARPRHQPSKSVPSVEPGFKFGGQEVTDDVIAALETQFMKPIAQTATGTRYGAALGGQVGLQLTGGAPSPRKWGAANPSCPRCGKSVYFAEQVKAVGKTYHKGCLRCIECNTLLDSSRLREHDGEPICMRCYGKLHGPQGGGYALLGKAGG